MVSAAPLSTTVDVSSREQALAILQTADLSADNPLADSIKFNVAQLFAREPNHQDCMDALKSINTINLSDTQFVEFIFLLAQTNIALLNPEFAQEALVQTRFVSLISQFNKSDKQRLLEIQAEVDFALGNFTQGFNTLIDIANNLKRRKDIRKIHDKIWDRISRLPYQHLEEGVDHTNITLAGWFQLGTASRRYQGNPHLQVKVYDEWRQRWKTHPAAKISPTHSASSEGDHRYPSQVALLLPLQDEYRIPSYTLIEGFLSAYHQALSVAKYDQYNAPEIRIYDTSSGSVQSLYNQAVADGADMIIGPLRQPQVESLITAPVLPVPILSLNRLDNEQLVQPENFYQFGLSTIDELVQIADRAWSKGLRKILLIVPDNSLGSRSAEFFHNYWTAKGGTLLEEVNYESSTNDFTQLLRPPLQIDLSEQRGLQIKRFVNSSVNFTARRRQDIDLVVMLGYPLKARQIKPALDFLYASDIPVVATSHIYSGDQQEEFDRDLSNIEFSSMPWTLNGHLPYKLNMNEKLHTAYRHLYAVGHDAFLLHSNLDQLKKADSTPLYGATGLLSLEKNVFVREQKWAVFERGKVREISN